MRKSSRLSGSRDAKATLAAIVIVAILIISTVGAVLLMTTGSSTEKVVASGSKITTNYIGQMPDGRVFDTSLLSVATDNTTYPKSLSFVYRTNGAYYTYNFTVGSQSVIEGFSEGVIGMKVGETKTFVVTPDQGYGEMNASRLRTANLNETIAVTDTMTVTAFTSYYGSAPVSHKLYSDPIYGWNVYVVATDGTNVVLQNQAVDGAVYKAYAKAGDTSYGWNVTTEVSGGSITVHHQLTSASALNVKGYDPTASSSLRGMFVESVDEANGTFVINQNNEVVGRNLTFTVTIVSIQ